jgi:hypothetical protein
MPTFELPQFWDDLSEEQAQEIFDNHIARHPQRVRAALDYLIEWGVESDALDFSNVSLQTIWPVVLRTTEIPDAADNSWQRGDMPTWAAFRADDSRRIGRRNVQIIEWLAGRHSPVHLGLIHL